MDMALAVLIFTTTLEMYPVHFGTVLVLNLCIGLCTLHALTILILEIGITKFSVSQVIKPLLPFLFIMVIVLLLIIYIPEISMFLPRLFNL
ncbi:TRAP transporter large permease subunit [Polaribacter sejongensis]|nr:TRAP transporter large permease subunit [Polaribacter undariae]